IQKPPPLHRRVVEVAGRVGADGSVVEELDLAAARTDLEAAKRAGIDAVAIVLIHAYAHPEFERHLKKLADAVGFDFVTVSHEVAREIGLLARGETTAVDAYLTPLLQDHVTDLAAQLPNAQLRFMQSSGGLTKSPRFRGPTALLSGPAGGVVGAAHVALRAGFDRALGFDMGGTSTDVSFIEDGEVDRGFETLVGGVRVKAPMMRIHTVAAGGGSLCRFDGFRFVVGPESAGSEPGPLCYGNPDATALALTDVNLVLGRVQPDRFPFRLERAPAEAALAAVRQEVRAAGHAYDVDAVAAGFVEVANASMAHAISEVSVARGVDPRDCALVGFGGAAGQHVCAIARELGIRNVLLHPLAGVLSAFGIRAAEVSWDGQRDAGRVPLPAAGEPLPAEVTRSIERLTRSGRAALSAEGVPADALRSEVRLDLRYAGTETPISVRAGADGDYAAAFATAHAARFGYTRAGRPVEIVTARVRVWAPARAAHPDDNGASLRRSADAPAAAASGGDAPVLRRERVWFPDVGRREVPVYERESLRPGARIEGPALVLEDTGTVVLDAGFRAELGVDGILFLHDEAGPQRSQAADLERADPVRLEVFGNRFMSIAEQMGAVLRNTSVSTNIKERLDYSCAVFDRSGGLVANAPHIPVHLGAMADTVRAMCERFAPFEPGDV
ncbi:MAG TPA: hydantoinase/oxoprolinase family protein, partial [bacterium]|nr:hydantoinase/oxoprolinase family protein [bacterium]